MVDDDPPPPAYNRSLYEAGDSGFDDMESDWPPPASYVGGADRYKNKAWKSGWGATRKTAVEPTAKMPTMMATYGEYTLKQALNNMPHLAGLDFLVKEICKREHMRGGDRGVLRLLDHIQGLTVFDVVDR